MSAPRVVGVVTNNYFEPSRSYNTCYQSAVRKQGVEMLVTTLTAGGPSINNSVCGWCFYRATWFTANAYLE